jgi:NADPH-ferrihemoprotein reductase
MLASRILAAAPKRSTALWALRGFSSCRVVVEPALLSARTGPPVASISSKRLTNRELGRVTLGRATISTLQLRQERRTPPLLIRSLKRTQTLSRSSSFSTLVKALSDSTLPIRILYASQGGTAQIFAQQLSEALDEQNLGSDRPITVQGCHESKAPNLLLTPGEAIHVFLVSVSGVGEPPDNGRAFYEWLMQDDTKEKIAASDKFSQLEYAVFGLGNKKAHPNHFNVIGKALDARLEEMGASRIFDLGLGDDGDCIEDDFDTWMENLCKVLNGGATSSSCSSDATSKESTMTTPREVVAKHEDILTISCPGIALTDCGTRIISRKYPTLNLLHAESDAVRDTLFHLQGTEHQFYHDDTAQLEVVSNELLTANAGETGLHELRVSLHDHYHHKDLCYETGDHLIVYPRNSQCMVEAYLNHLDVDRHAVIAANQSTDCKSYPHPFGLTVYETLSHCVDLGAVPSPGFARMVLGRREIDYKNEIANPRRTVIDLIYEAGGTRMSLEDLLFNLSPMRPRYYSIASSATRHPDEVYVAFRPVKYMTSRGILREGVCTSYMSQKGVVLGGDHFSSIAARINPNPTFRLPADPETSILMIAGGCGIAPIRAFLEERISMNASKYGPAQLYLGFRNPSDEMYKSLVQEAADKGAVTEAKVSYSSGCTSPEQRCMLVSELVRSEAKSVFEHLESGGHTFLCGGARTFGAAIEKQMLELIQEQGKMDFEQASAYMKNLVSTGRLSEDLAD